MRWKAREKKLLGLVKRQHLSPSHDVDHLTRVAAFGVELAKMYQARREIVVAAALTHDVARVNTHLRGKATAVAGARLAAPLLKKAGYKSDEIAVITQCIREHDQPHYRSKLLESRILKDADYLDGFGARGIVRSVLYAGETNEGISEVVRRLKVKGRERLHGLEFKESQRLGWKLYRLTELLLDELGQESRLAEVTYPGKLIVLEGISGSGKDTQAKLLERTLAKKGIRTVVVNHPTKFLKGIWRRWRTQVNDRASEAFLMLADRVRMVREVIVPALQKGTVVISTRSSVSAQVYQEDPLMLSTFYRRAFSFEPLPDLVVYLEVPSTVALRRTDYRVKAGKEKDRGFFGKDQRERQRRYAKILNHYPHVVRVDASGSKTAVHTRLVEAVRKHLNVLQG